MGVRISNIEVYLPDNILTNKELEDEFKRWESDKIESKLGIRNRHITVENETALDLAFRAAVRVLEKTDKESIDFVLLCTQSPEYFLPSGSCILQDKLELRTDIGAFDYNLGCSGYIYGLAVAKGLINSNIANKILLIMSETYSKYIHSKDLANRTIFGDGAAATILEKSDEEHVFEFILGTDGKGYNNLIVNNGGLRNRYNNYAAETKDESGNIWTDNNLFMNGPEIFNFSIEAVPKVIEQVLRKNNLSLDEINYVIFHQANKYMINYLRKILNIPLEKFYMNMVETGNTVSATIPIALKDCIDSKLINNGDKVLLCGFGVGYSWGATIVKI